MSSSIPVQDASVTPTDAARRLTQVLYALYVLSFFSGGLTGLAAILINHIKYRDARKTLYGSHFRWQMQTFWWTAALWTLVFVVAFVGSRLGDLPAWRFGYVLGLMLCANVLWVVYRIIRGALACIDGRRMPV